MNDEQKGTGMFNDPIAAKRFERFQAEHRFNTIIETGTEAGNGTLGLARWRPVVITIEWDRRFREMAVENWKKHGFGLWPVESKRPWFAEMCLVQDGTGAGVWSYLGNSPIVLASLLGRSELNGPFLFYLDAHGGDYWPLLDELKVIAGLGLRDSCIIIHDFQVPGKPWGFDSYKGQPLDMDYVKADLLAINPNYRMFYNEEACEGPAGRGILYVVP